MPVVDDDDGGDGDDEDEKVGGVEEVELGYRPADEDGGTEKGG